MRCTLFLNRNIRLSRDIASLGIQVNYEFSWYVLSRLRDIRIWKLRINDVAYARMCYIFIILVLCTRQSGEWITWQQSLLNYWLCFVQHQVGNIFSGCYWLTYWCRIVRHINKNETFIINWLHVQYWTDMRSKGSDNIFSFIYLRSRTEKTTTTAPPIKKSFVDPCDSTLRRLVQ